VKELVEFIAKGLVDAPAEVAVEQPASDLLELRVAADDRGKVIGKKGRTAHAIRTVLAAISPPDAPASLEIID
jgi:uncharacterized protein